MTSPSKKPFYHVAKARSKSLTKALGLLWVGGEGVTIGKMLALGALIWGLYSVANIAVNGVVLDEVVIPAQIITGAVPYPPGHPHQVYYPRVFNLPNYLAAGLWAIVPDPWFISAIRNFLFLFLSVFVPFALTVLLTRQPLWGHLASILMVSETLIRFRGVYPQWVFPNFYSHGHIGLYVALLIVVLLLARFWRTGGLLLGLLPSLHPAMAIIVWPWSGCYLFLATDRPRGKDRFRLVASTCTGLAVCVVGAVLVLTQTTNVGVRPPYDAQANGELIRQHFIATNDVHRQPIRLWTFGYLVNPAAFFVIGSLLLRNTKRQRTDGSDASAYREVLWILVLGGIVWVCVYGARLFEIFVGPLPFYVELMMPSRFSNLATVLLVPMTVAALARAQKMMSDGVCLLATALVTGLILVAGVVSAVDPGRVANYLLLVIWGLLFAMDLCEHGSQPKGRLVRLPAVVIVGGSLFQLAKVNENLMLSFVVFVASFLLYYAIFIAGTKLLQQVRLNHQRWHSGLQVALICGCVTTGVVALAGRGIKLEPWEMFSLDDRELDQWLATNARSDEMILPAMFPRTELQAKTNHPILIEPETLWLMTYMPHLAPTIGMMVRDLFGIDYSDPEQLRRISHNGGLRLASVWLKVWEKRSRKEWQSLGRKYSFRLVLSPTKTPLDLPIALPGPRWTLYVIPT